MNAQAAPTVPFQRFWSILLVMCLIQFSGAWIYPSSADAMADTLHIEKAFGVPYQYMLWCLIMLGFFLHVHTFGLKGYFNVIKLFMPFWLIGILAGLFGFDPISSTRAVILWALMATGAACVGAALPAERLIKLICVTLGAIMVLSIVIALALPSVGTQAYGASMVWRGAFFGKNIMGWVGAMTMVINMAAMREGNTRWTGIVAFLGLVCMLGSQSKGAAVAGVVTVGYLFMIRRFSRKLTPGFAMSCILVLIVVAAVSAFLISPILLELMGRDATLTGRTDVWSTFFNSMIRTPWLGQGPGAYSQLSPLTAPLAAKLTSLGTIVTPHNVFLGVLGDTGLFGLVIFLCTLFYLAMVLPLTRPGRGTMMCAAVGFLIMAHGLVETHEVLAPGIGWFLLMLSYAVSLKEAQEPSQQADSKPAPVESAARSEMRYAARRIG